MNLIFVIGVGGRMGLPSITKKKIVSSKKSILLLLIKTEGVTTVNLLLTLKTEGSNVSKSVLILSKSLISLQKTSAGRSEADKCR
jgi:hypothetical protein